MNLPEKYVNSIQDLLGDDADDYFKSLLDNSKKGFRINNLKVSKDEFKRVNPFEKIDEIPFINNGYYYSLDENISKHPYYHAGLFYLQEPSAMLPANRLPIEKDDFVLDLCAAPGGKATELAAKLDGTGVLYANDISASRAKALLKNLENCGANNFYVTAQAPNELASKLKGYFNKILVDAPCSGEGMFRKDESLIASWEENGPEYYAKIQKDVLDSAVELLSDGGMLMYSTCTFSILEDEANVDYILKKYPEMHLMEIDGYDGFTEGFSERFNNDELKKCVRVFPHKMDGEGHFLALFKKDGNCPVHEKSERKEFIDKNGCKYLLPGYRDNGYRAGLRYLRTGLFIGEDVKGKKFKYSNAYALSLKKGEFSNELSLKLDDVRVTKYLKGETIFLDEDEKNDVSKGYVLILLDKYPLGFAINDGRGTLKNMYNQGWRMN